jgi:hypothetical protein
MPTNSPKGITNLSIRKNVATLVLGNHGINNKEMINVLASAIMYRNNRKNVVLRRKNNTNNTYRNRANSELRLNEQFAREFLRGISKPIKLNKLENKRNYLM